MGSFPVWTYWEGVMPEWIRLTLGTITSHAEIHKHIDPEQFDSLWDCDRDIKISSLYVAHRADFIRAFLLWRYGGLWIDADCIVLKPLAQIIEPLMNIDFAVFSHANGRLGNSFIYAAPDSHVAAAYFERVKLLLRCGGKRTWRSLGGDAIERAIESSDRKVHFFPQHLIQPIMWHEPLRYFVVARESRHAARFQKSAICYMLSNHAIKKYRRKDPDADLTRDGSFFNYLVAQASVAGRDSAPM
jgi:hypothetical protein